MYSASLYYQCGILKNEEELATHSKSQKGAVPSEGLQEQRPCAMKGFLAGIQGKEEI